MTPQPSPEERRTFAGYPRDRGVVGIRNKALVLPSVICSHAIADRIADAVPGAVSTPHDHGCAQLGDDADQTRRTFLGLATNPNVTGVLVVGLGCETIQSDEVADALEDRDVPVEEVAIQDAGGTRECYEAGVERVRELVATGPDGDRTPVDLSDLTVGVVSSDLDESTLARADPLVGELVGRIVDAGGRALVAGNERFSAHGDAFRERFATDDAVDGYAALRERLAGAPARVTGVDARARGASAGELARLWDDRPVVDVLRYGERATHDTGVALVDAPSQFAEAATGLVAAGAQLVVHVTADGVPAGHPVAPVLKVTGDRATYDALERDIDLFAGSNDVDALERAVLDALDGDATAAEEHGVTTFAITRSGPST